MMEADNNRVIDMNFTLFMADDTICIVLWDTADWPDYVRLHVSGVNLAIIPQTLVILILQ